MNDDQVIYYLKEVLKETKEGLKELQADIHKIKTEIELIKKDIANSNSVKLSKPPESTGTGKREVITVGTIVTLVYAVLTGIYTFLKSKGFIE